MIIEPSSNIYILKDCPLESSYDHTLWFDSVDAQTDYFQSLAKYRFTKVSYQRKDRGYLKLEVPVENLYDCNYIMFQNEKFGDKWFYAFLTNQEYVSNNVSLIKYSLDAMQTWFFDYTINECFVEREHVADDTLGKHTVPEKLDIGEYQHIYLDQNDRFSWKEGDYVVGVITVYDEAAVPNPNRTGIYGGVYSGLNILYFEDLGEGGLQSWIQQVVDNNGEDGIIAMFMCPKDFYVAEGSGSKHYDNEKCNTSDAVTWTYTYGDGNEQKTGPRNNKLYTYPFNLLVVNTMAGQTGEFRFEFMDDPKKFEYILDGTFSAPPVVGLYPRNYNGQTYDRTEMVTLDSFPQCAFVTDSYRAWVAMNYRTQNVQGVGTIAQGVLGTLGSLAGGSPLGALTNIAGSATNIGKQIAAWKTAETLPPRAHGELNTTLPMANDSLGFRFYNMRIRPEYARIIDDYFDRYGYAVHTQKVPNRNVRPHWTYTKTVNCTITGSVPNDDMQKIIAIYNRGITFWVKGSEVGNYTLDNRVSTSPDPGGSGGGSDDDDEWSDGWYHEDQELTRSEMVNNAIFAYNAFHDLGWADTAIFAILGSMQRMTTINPGLTTDNGDAYGLIKWNPKQYIIDYCESIDKPVDSGDAQVQCIDEKATDFWTERNGYNIPFAQWKQYDDDLDTSVEILENNYFNHTDANVIQLVKNYARSWKMYLMMNDYLR